MASIDLQGLVGDDFVLHFGGRTNEINAHTFANSLLAFSEALREINAQVNPDFSLEIVIDALGTGSFRARLKAGGTKLTSLFKNSAHAVLIGLLTSLIWDRLNPPPQMQIVIQDDSYVVQRGKDRIILPKAVYEAKERLRNVEEIDRHIARAFEILEEDPSITEFGITSSLKDPKPLALIEREDFALLSEPTERVVADANHRVVEQRADLVVLRAVLERGNRKWQFVWNGIRIPAPIKDATFYDKLASREYEFGQGDTLHATLAIYQVRDDISGAYLNERYEVLVVHGRTPGPKQPSFLP
ncbi:MAG TPA: hypothetical protein VNH44_03120 [Micropepsaceae bacterium]|nr:hypothetical protein [Micropepsaceae bacterium]